MTHPLCKKLEEARRLQGKSYRELELKSGVGREAIRRWGNGTQTPHLGLLECVATVLGMEIRLVRKPKNGAKQ